MKKQPVGQTLGRIASSTRIVTETDVYDPVTNPDGMLVTDATLATKQDKLIAGENITIAEDGKTISATGGGVVECDDALSADSTNPIQNQWLGKRMGATETNSVQIGYNAKAGTTSGASVSGSDDGNQVAVGNNANGSAEGTAVGNYANGNTYGAAVGFCANGASSGAAVGNNANGYNNGAAVGYGANGYNNGAAVGYNAQGYDCGAAVGRGAQGHTCGVAVGYGAGGYDYGVAVGYCAQGHTSGVAVGSGADGSCYGAAVGYGANGYGNGVAVGYGADGSCYGAAVGFCANGASSGAAVGNNANSNTYGAAVGYSADGSSYGVAVGSGAGGACYGAAVGNNANGFGNGIAIGINSTTNYTSYTATIGVESSNNVQYSLQISAYNNAQQTFFAQRLIAGETLDDSYIDFYHRDRISGEIKGRRISATNFFALLDANGATDISVSGGDYSGDYSA